MLLNVRVAVRLVAIPADMFVAAGAGAITVQVLVAADASWGIDRKVAKAATIWMVCVIFFMVV